MARILITLLIALCCVCPAVSGPAGFDIPRLVSINGYEDHAMNPFLSRDGNTLFFNSRSEPGDEPDIHFARRDSDLEFAYTGPLKGDVNTDDLEASPSMTADGDFYFVSPRNFETSRNALWWGRHNKGEVSDAQEAEGRLSGYRPLWLNMDAEISADGNTLYVVENRTRLFGGGLQSANIFAAYKSPAGTFYRTEKLDAYFANINTDKLEFGPSVSADELTLYFMREDTHAVKEGTDTAYQIFVSTRKSKSEAFNTPKQIKLLYGEIGAPTISPDNCSLYFHQKVRGVYRIMLSKRNDCASR